MLKYLPSIEDLGYQEVKLVQDEDSHNYLIPAEFEKDFEKWQEMDTWYQDEEKEETRTFLEKLFEGYRTSGGVTTKLFAKEGYQQETDF